ncbi:MULTISPECIES: hypothetical protein [unclassified Phyllobacterium]|uniref:hypothetical protein n=1 Tax=unclassified Phyllobacterium TaxID=2638441 RepID=UPI003012F2EF
MSYSEWKPVPESFNFKCRECGSLDVEFQEYESPCGGYEDYFYHCMGCDRRWHVEGADA